MAGSRKQRHHAKSPKSGKPPPTRIAFEGLRTVGFDKSLDGLGLTSDAIPILQRFMLDWNSGADLSRWDYKGVKGEPAKKVELKQIDLLGNYRVWLTMVTERAKIYFLEVARRVTNMDKFVDRAIVRARAIREGTS